MPMTRQEIRYRIGTNSPDILDLIADCVRAAEEDEREACALQCENDPLLADDWIPTMRPGKHFAWSIRQRLNNDDC